MGFLQWLGIKNPRDEPKLPDIQDNVRDSGTLFVFGQANSGERVDERSAMQISTVYACVRLLAESVAQLPLHLYRTSTMPIRMKCLVTRIKTYFSGGMRSSTSRAFPLTVWWAFPPSP